MSLVALIVTLSQGDKMDIYSERDIERLLLAAEQSTKSALAASGDGDYSRGYAEGHRAALTTIALAVGVALPQPATWRVIDTDVIEARRH